MKRIILAVAILATCIQSAKLKAVEPTIIHKVTVFGIELGSKVASLEGATKVGSAYGLDVFSVPKKAFNVPKLFQEKSYEFFAHVTPNDGVIVGLVVTGDIVEGADEERLIGALSRKYPIKRTPDDIEQIASGEVAFGYTMRVLRQMSPPATHIGVGHERTVQRFVSESIKNDADGL
jgi:hypothetical protein